VEIAMDELENYECFGVPAQVWAADEVVKAMPAGASTRRIPVRREWAMLGVEAMPSPALPEFQPAK
jgi:hypothetical protein